MATKATVLKDKDGTSLYPVTDVSLVVGLQEGAIMESVVVSELPTADATTVGKIYMIPSATVTGEYDRYMTTYSNSAYTWTQLGSTAIPSPVIADNLTTNDATQALSAKQGKVLNDNVTQLGQDVDDLEGAVNGGTQTITYIDNEYVNNTNGAFVHYNGWSRTNYIDVQGLATLNFNNPGADSLYNAFYDVEKHFIKSFRTLSNYSGAATVPENAKWAVLSNTSSAIRQLTISNLPNKKSIDELRNDVVELQSTVAKSQNKNINTATSIADIESLLYRKQNTRIDFLLPVLLDARVQIGVNSAYRVSYTLQKADGTALYDSAWATSINVQDTIYNYPNTSRVMLYFKKADGSVTSLADIEENAVSEMVVDYVKSEWAALPNLTIENSLLKQIHDLSVGGSGILDLNPEKEVVPKLGNLDRRYISYGGSATQHPPVLSFIHMSDAHADNENILRIKDFYDQYKDTYINGGVIDTGDFIGQNLAQGLPSSISEVPDFIRILGNHDAYYYVNGSWQLAPQLDCYNVCFKDYIGDWGVVQPENAAANGYCYFYKDFAENGVMMVALDYDHWDSTQNTWLVNTLATALSLGRHVVILVHRAPFRINADTNNPFQNVDYINRTFADHSPMTDVYTAVKNFIDTGGTFVCYLCGHLHDDYFGLGRDTDTSNQLVIGVGCASGKTAATVSGTMSRIAGQRSQDCFNVVGIDTTSKTIKIMRIGADYDRYMRKKNTLSWNYGTGQLIYVN